MADTRRELILARKESLEDMLRLLVIKKLFPKKYTVPEAVVDAINSSDFYPLRGRSMVTYHQEVLYQLVRDFSAITRREFYKITQCMGGSEKFANHTRSEKKLLENSQGEI